MIYNNFEIIEKETIKLFINDIYKYNEYYLECTLNEGKIIIHYPDNFNGENKYVSVIGSLNNENTFITEYILIYKEIIYRDDHLKK